MALDAAEKAAEELRTAIDRLRVDILRIEIWAGALSGFAKPVPNYDGGDSTHLLLAPRRDDKTDPNH